MDLGEDPGMFLPFEARRPDGEGPKIQALDLQE
jgi:hypothetical protein